MISVSRKLALVAAACLAFCASAFAQQKVSGTVLDVSKQPVIGATVMEKGTSNGVSTTLDGEYTLTVKPGATLVVSCIGYADQEVVVASGKSVYDFTLSEDNTMLEETVVIGYGTVKVKDLTGSVAAVGSKDLQTPVANVGEALQGKMAGVVVSLNDGTPGAEPQIRVRGAKSITQTNDPLYIVDGFPVGSLANIPSDQIKSINVLKDAAATAIYGSRGASGVVIVTTKNAVEGQTQVSYNGYVQIKDSSKNVRDVMDPLDFLKFTLGYADAYTVTSGGSSNEALLDYYGMSLKVGNTMLGTANNYNGYKNAQIHNWQSDLYKTAITHSHNLSISNGTKRNKTIFNLNFLNDDGTVINSGYQRANASLKTIENLTENFNVELNVSYAYSRSRTAQRVSTAYQYRPIDKPLGNESNLNGFGQGLRFVSDQYDPVALSWNQEDYSYNHVFRAIAALNWKPVKGLALRSEIGLGKNFTKVENYNGGYGVEVNSATLRRAEGSNLHWTSTASYNVPFKTEAHRLDFMVGNEMIMSSSEYMQFYGYEYPSNFDRETTFAMMNQFTDNYTFTTNIGTPGRSVSFFGRANYALLDRYLFTATLRADGSSKFAPNNRWGYFPAFAFAWRAIDEPWMSSTRDWLSNLKVRLSYGATGSDAISANLWKETWSLGNNTAYTIGDNRENTENSFGQPYAPGTLMMNNDLKWETTITRNLGVDFGFWDDRLYGTIEGYWSTTKDLLMPVAVNSATGYSYQYQNMGVVSNKGIELSLGGDIIRNKDFSLSANLIYNYNKNVIEELAESVKVTEYGQWANSFHRPQNGEFILKEGSGIGLIRAYEYDGWYTVDDFNYDPSTGIYTLKEGVPDVYIDSYSSRLGRPAKQSAFPGAVKIKDRNGDGSLTQEDLYEVGEMTPPHNGSFNLNMRWKNFDLSANFNFVLGGHILNYQALMSTYGERDDYFGANRLSFVKDSYTAYRWTSDGNLEFVSDPEELTAMNANATMHTPTSLNGFLLDTYIEDASYLRLKNITLGYTIPSNITKKIGVKNLRAYLTATNLFTLTKYSGLDPEVNTSRTSSYNLPTPGIDNNAYPIARSLTIGLNITL